MKADSVWAQRLGLAKDTVFKTKQELLDLLNQTTRSKTNAKVVEGIPGVTKMLTHQISNINAGIQQDATHSTKDSHVILPSQMFNAFTFKGYSQKEVNEIYSAIADIAVRGLSDTFFADPRPVSEIKAQLLNEGVNPNDADTQAKRMKEGKQLDFSELVKSVNTNTNPQAKEEMMEAYKEILMKKAKSGDDFGLFGVLTETFSAMGMPIDNPHMFNAAVSELANKFSKEAIKIKFDGQFAVLKPGSGSQQVYEITGGTMPYKDGMTLKYRTVEDTEVVTRDRAREWAAHNGVDIATMKPRNLQGQYVTMIDSNGVRTQLSMASGEQLIPEARALATAKKLIGEYKDLSTSEADHDALYKKFLVDLKGLPKDSGVQTFLDRYIDAIPDDKLKKDIKKGDSLGKVFTYMNPESKYFSDTVDTKKGDNAKLLYLAKLNTLGKVLTHELNNFMSEASQGLVPQSLHGEGINNLTGHKIEISRAEVIVDLTARDKFGIREGDDISDINEGFFLNRLLEKSKDANGIPYYGAERMIQSGNQRILFHYGTVPSKYDVNITDQAEWDPKAQVMNVYGTPEAGNANKLLFSLKGETSIRIIDGNMHIFLNNDKVVNDEQKQKEIQGTTDSNYKRVQAYLASQYKIKAVDLTVNREEEAVKEYEQLALKAKQMNNSWLKYLDVIGTRIPGQHYQSFQGLRIVGFATGNKVFVPNEVTMLAGSDFDIDKMNMIYYSIDNDGLLSKWHPAFNYDSKENMELSMQLPLPIGRKKSEFLSQVVAGVPIDKLINLPTDYQGTLPELVWLYNELKDGKKLGNDEASDAVAQQLEDYDDKSRFKITGKGINNFTISRANAVINNPKNYPLLQKPVSMTSPQLMGGMSKEGKDAKQRSKEQPSSIVQGKYDNMVGKDMIGVVASSGLKALSGMTAVYNKAIMDLSDLSFKREKLNNIPITSENIAEIKAAKEQLNKQIDDLKQGFTTNFSVANINFENASEAVLNLINPRFTANVDKESEFDIAKKYTIQNMMEGLSDDAAEIDSELLSAATDNAKELILSKIRATPEFGTIYTALIGQGVPFWKIVQTMTNPTTDFYLKYFNKEAFVKNHLNFDSVLNMASSIQNGNEKDAKGNLKDEQLYRHNQRVRQLKEYGFVVKNNDLENVNTGDTESLTKLNAFNGYLKQGKEMQILGKYLGINQGIKAKPFELYSFTKTIETHLLDTYGMQFNFTDFLNSLSGDGIYTNDMIHELTEKTPAAFNLLFVLAKATNFEKQLQGFSVTNQVLVDSTYKMNAAYNITRQLEGYAIGNGKALNEDQFNEVQRFVDNTVLLKFFENETKSNSDPATRPVFYDGDNRLQLTTVKGRNDFIKWVHDKFVPSIKNMADFKNNEFVRDLTYETVADRLFSEKVPIVRMTYDTTNAISEETKSKADNYKFNLNQLRFGYDKDPSLPTTNNLFNVLFWYNTLINKGGTGKYSWAKMQNELIMNDINHPFRRLAELQGELGKATSIKSDPSEPDIKVINGIPFDRRNLLIYHNIIGENTHTSLSEAEAEAYAAKSKELNAEEPDYDQSHEYDSEYDQHMFDTEGQEESEFIRTGLVKVEKDTRKGNEGTIVQITDDNGHSRIEVKDPSISIPYELPYQLNTNLNTETQIKPSDSARAIREIGQRFQELNPDVQIDYKTTRQLIELSNATNFDYTQAKAFILNGRVNINLNKASMSDVVHEYGHLFLHTLKYESLEMYNNLVQLAKNNPKYDQIQNTYSHLQGDDLNEEVFVTLFGEAMQQKASSNYNGKELMLNFADYTKTKLNTVLNKEVNSILELSPQEVANLTLEDAINLVGDEVMKNRIDNIYDTPLASVNEIAKLKDDLFKLGLLTEYCGG